MEGERIVTIACEAYTSTSSTKLGIQVHLDNNKNNQFFAKTLSLLFYGISVCLPALLPPLHLATSC